MDDSRRASREGNEITLQYQTRHEILDEEESSEDKLTQLLAFIGQHEQTPAGAAELERRRKLFGECERDEGETSVQFCARLHDWLNREIPQTKLPLHAPRQTGDLFKAAQQILVCGRVGRIWTEQPSLARLRMLTAPARFDIVSWIIVGNCS